MGPLLPLRRGALLAGAGLLVGSLPASLYYLTQQDPGQGNLGSARRFLDVGLDLSWPRLSRFVIEVPPLVIGTYYFDPKTWLRIAALILALGIYLAAIVCVGVRTFSARREAPPSRAWGVWLLLLTLVATFAALYFSEFSQVGAHARARYVLPAYIPLFVFLGAALAALARRSQDLGTEWPARRLAESEATPLVVDMGATHAVARLVLWPTAPTDVLVPLEVAGSMDATTWERLGVTPAHVAEPAFAVRERPLFRPRNGWLELVDLAAPRAVPPRAPRRGGVHRRRDGGRALRLRGRRSAS